MKKASRFEIFIDSLIPYAIVLIIAITIADLFFYKYVRPHYWIIDVLDLWILWVFIMDMGFKLMHARTISHFLRHNWFYIIAIFPFFLIFRVVESFYHVSVSSGSALILGRYIMSVINETRLAKFAEIFKVLGISSRLLRAVYFYENPKIRHKIKLEEMKVGKLLGFRRRKKR